MDLPVFGADADSNGNADKNDASGTCNNAVNNDEATDLVTSPAARPCQSLSAERELLPLRGRSPHARASHAIRLEPEPMGPILRRKMVVSMPLGAGGDFFYTLDEAAPGHHRALLDDKEWQHKAAPAGATSGEAARRKRQSSYDPCRIQQALFMEGAKTTDSSVSPHSSTNPARRRRQATPQANDFMRNLVRRRQVSLDLLGPNDFFGVPEPPSALIVGEEKEEPPTQEALTHEVGGATCEEDNTTPAFSMAGHEDQGGGAHTGKLPPVAEKQLFRPLRFAPRQTLKSGHGGGPSQRDPDQQEVVPLVSPETKEAMIRYTTAHEQIKADLVRLVKTIPQEDETSTTSQMLSDVIHRFDAISADHLTLKTFLVPAKEKSGMSRKDSNSSLLTAKTTAEADVGTTIMEQDDINAHLVFQKPESDELEEGHQDHDGRVLGQQGDGPDVNLDDIDNEDGDAGVVRVTRTDVIKAVVCFFIMLGLTIVVTLWHTHLDEGIYVLKPVGLACVTSCPGNLETRDFFDGHSHFNHNDVIDLYLHLDANEVAAEHEAKAVVEIVGVESGLVQATYEFGPVMGERLSYDKRVSFQREMVADFELPEEHHIINVNSTHPEVELSFTLLAVVKNPLAEYSVIVATIIMLLVYILILLEVIHRTLISIYGSMIALMFLFIMDGGHVESIKMIMLQLEWSTLGLLFGMMLIVGELSHTGVFEWCAVRILIFSNGSYVRLLILLSVLTAVASAFLDNVTTMLLVAPVTIDMCHIVGGIDPRPYLIAEVLLSNVGGTATLIGDPPNIIIGASFSDIIGFVDFIIHVFPVIFFFCVPACLVLLVFLYRWYLTSSKMRVLDAALLKKTYRIYDEPRLLFSGIVTAFVILMFFLHPVHHKDTAWIALLGAFVTIAFTNPHDIQSALRSHVEWDTLLFFAGLFVLVEVCASMGLLQAIGDALASYIEAQPPDQQEQVAITLILWVSAFASSFLDNIPYTATMIPVIEILAFQLPETLNLQTLAWALSLGACLGGNGTLLGASANIVTAGISTNKGYDISFLNFLYPGMLVMITTVAISNMYMLVRYVWIK